MTRDEFLAKFAETEAKINDFLKSGIQAQYRDSNVNALIQKINEIHNKYCQRALKSLILDNISLSTAKGTGLDLWGVILSLSRYVLIEIKSEVATYYLIEDDDYRNLLMVLYQKQFINTDLPSINHFTQQILGKYGDIRVKDTYDMTYIIYEFNSEIPNWLKWSLNEKDILPRPAGVGVKINDASSNIRVFGFAPSEHDKESAPAAYEARKAYFESNVGAFNETIFSSMESKT